MIDKNDLYNFLIYLYNLFLRLFLSLVRLNGFLPHIHINEFENNNERSQQNEAGAIRPFCRLDVGHNLRHKLGHRAFFRVVS